MSLRKILWLSGANASATKDNVKLYVDSINSFIKRPSNRVEMVTMGEDTVMYGIIGGIRGAAAKSAADALIKDATK